MDLNSKSSLLQDKKTIKSKKFLHRLYGEFYAEMKNRLQPISRSKRIIELGSGGGFVKDIIPNVITSDLLKAPGIDKIMSAEKIPLRSGSVDAFIMLNTFHHIKHPKKALTEMQRCLKPKGRIIMIEPWKTNWSTFIYTYFHHEPFQPHADWLIPGTNRMTDANGALPWIVFKRDRGVFHKTFPHLHIQNIRVHTPFRYLLSGGLSKPQLIPNSCYPITSRVEEKLKPMAHSMGMFATITLLKR